MTIDFQSEAWKDFKVFAEGFYGECLEVAVRTAGQENPETSQVLLARLTPDLLTLWEFYQSSIRGLN